MQRIRISSIKVGQQFAQSLFSCTGQKLLHADVAINERHLGAMRRCGDVEVILADSIDELVEAGIVARFDSSGLRVGQMAREGVMTPTGQVVLEPGQEVEAHHLDALEVGGRAYVSKATVMAERRERILMADALVEDLLQQLPLLPLRVPAEPAVTWVQPAEAAEWPAPEQLIQERQAAVEALRKSYAGVEAGLSTPVSGFGAIVEQLLQQLRSHPTRFTQLALLCPRREDYLPDHAYTVTVLAMAIAAQLKWSLADVRRIGLAGLLFDLGMLLVPERIRTGACELTDIDRSRVRRHPVFSVALLQVVEGTEPILQLASLQHHERENGTGYPTGTRRDNICDFARVLTVADTFAATTEPRHYRRPKLPYVAMEETLRSTTAMAVWKPAVRALLQAAGLFPVGSYVKLSSGKNAHVIAANPAQLDRPTVQPLDVEGHAEGAPIDLATMRTEELAVIRPLALATG